MKVKSNFHKSHKNSISLTESSSQDPRALNLRKNRKFYTVTAIFALICFIYGVMNDLKNVFVISRQVAASIQVIKLIFVPVTASIFSVIVQIGVIKSSNLTVLKYFIIGYSIYFIFLGFTQKYWDSLELNKIYLADAYADGKMAYKKMEFILPFAYSIVAYNSTLYYVAAEIWSSVVLSLLFFSVLFDIFTEEQFLAFFPLISIAPNAIRIFYGILAFVFRNKLESCSFNTNVSWSQFAFFLLSACSISTFFLLRTLEIKPVGVEKDAVKRKKEKASLSRCLKVMASSNVALAICGLNLFLCLTMNMAENFGNACIEVKAGYHTGSVESYVHIRQCLIQIIIGTISLLILVSPLANWISKHSWYSLSLMFVIPSAILSLLIYLIASINTGLVDSNLNFINLLVKKAIGSELTFAKYINLLSFEETCGLVVSACYKTFKYTIFDICKEALGMKIEPKYRYVFKSVYDGIIPRIGKALGSVLSVIFLFLLGGKDIRVASVFYFIAGIFLFLAWHSCVRYLGRKYSDAQKRNCFIEI